MGRGSTAAAAWMSVSDAGLAKIFRNVVEVDVYVYVDDGMR
jgi:hypothetical protein